VLTIAADPAPGPDGAQAGQAVRRSGTASIIDPVPGITISAGYGAGGSVVAPRVAERLGWSFVDRAISSTVAERLHLPVRDVERGGSRSPSLTRFLVSLAPLAPQLDDLSQLSEDAQVRQGMEEELRRAVRDGAVVLGRAGACALLDQPGVLRVRLYGPQAARVAQGARIEGVGMDIAQRRVERVDRARDAYVQRLYGRSADDPSLYHLQLDSTVLPVDACVDLVVAAWTALAGEGTPSR
jgi:cytidylate kinase